MRCCCCKIFVVSARIVAFHYQLRSWFGAFVDKFTEEHCIVKHCNALLCGVPVHCGSVGCGEDAMCILEHQCIVEQSSTYRYQELESNIFGTGIKYIWGRICIVSWYGNLHTYKSRHCIIVDVAVTNPITSVRLSKYQEEWQHRPSHLKGHPLTCDRSRHVVTCVTFH